MKRKLAAHVYEEYHRICWNVVTVIQLESSGRCWEHEESPAGGVFGKSPRKN